MTRWLEWLDAEQIGPSWDRLRHAQLLAAISNSGRISKDGGGLFSASDYMPADPWSEQKPTTVADMNRELESMFDG